MKFIVVTIFIVFLIGNEAKITKKTSQKDQSVVLNKKILGKPKPRAIIAIEIVDPNENSTKSGKNSKRTINSHLGYGYQNFNSYQAPKYEVYKYSQHDIPPYKGSSNIFSGDIKSHNIDIQKSVSYNYLPTVQETPKYSQTQNLNNYYQPGTTLFSTINNKGQLDSLSQTIPSYGQEPQVPVLILRVYPNQLSDPSAILHPNLPQNHPLASALNNVDLHSLLQKYVENSLLQQPHQQNYQVPAVQTHQHTHQQQGYHYQPSLLSYYPQTSDNNYQQHHHQQQQPYHYQQPSQYYSSSSLLTHENFPKDTHTRVIFRNDKINNGARDSSVPVALPKKKVETKTIKIHLPPGLDVHPSTYTQYQQKETSNDYYEQPKTDYYFNNQGNTHESYFHMEQPSSNHEQSSYQQGGESYDEQPSNGYNVEESNAYQYEQPSADNYEYSHSVQYEKTQEQSYSEEALPSDATIHNHQKRKIEKRKKSETPPQVTEDVQE